MVLTRYRSRIPIRAFHENKAGPHARAALTAPAGEETLFRGSCAIPAPKHITAARLLAEL